MPNQLPVLNIIGLMSGTSMDGIDACLVQTQLAKIANGYKLEKAEIIATHSADYPDSVRQKLFALVQQPEQCHLKTLCELNFEVAMAFAETACQLKQKTTLVIDAIASHGQTVFHQPAGNNVTASTLQLGDISVIAQKTGIQTVGNFRTADMAQGGQGAPLVPFADELLFRDNTLHRAVHNLGGISNTTVLPNYQTNQAIFAFDTGPANCLINSLSEKYFQQPFDNDGQYAKSGSVNTELLSALLLLPYLNQVPPKSTGRELFSDALLQRYFYSGPFETLSPQDKIATATALTVESIRQAYKQFVLPVVPVHEVIFGGGGTQNNYLMQQLSDALSPFGIIVKTHADFDIPNQYKEALAFALLGYANLCGIPANIPSCTGAQKSVLLGQVASL